MLPEDVAPDDVEVYEENSVAVEVFLELGTQWRHGMSGITGLDYAAIWTPIRIRRVPRDEWRQLFADIRVMEKTVLEVVSEQRKNG